LSTNNPQGGINGMSQTTFEPSTLIANLQTLHREIPIEGDQQLVTMIKLFWNDIPYHIEAHRELEALKRGKAPTGIAEVTEPLHLPGHKSMSMRLIPD
jgi:hypothetical protein